MKQIDCRNERGKDNKRKNNEVLGNGPTIVPLCHAHA